MSEHTPGPWEVEETGITGRPKVRCGNYEWWEVSASSIGDSTANARLIASAPELLETLKYIVSYRRNMTNEQLENIAGVNDGKDRAIKLVSCILIAEALIDKIKGEAD
jgi:hypothetical protein